MECAICETRTNREKSPEKGKFYHFPGFFSKGGRALSYMDLMLETPRSPFVFC